MISKDDIKKLATLARIEVAEDEQESVAHEIDGILAYVGEIKNAVSGNKEIDVTHVTKNVFREDVVFSSAATPHELIKSAPESEGDYVKVKKIL